MAKIPNFKTLEEAADFWDSHDFEDYVAATESVTVSVRIPRRQTTLRIPLGLKLHERIAALAEERNVSVEQLISAWLKQKVAAESTGR